jgi:hypothetical protein
MCGATDCPSCGPAQGYEVVRVWANGRWKWVNPEEDEDELASDEDADEDALSECTLERDSETDLDRHHPKG